MSSLARTSFPALGTTAVVVAEPDGLGAATAVVARVLEDIDRTCSRFRSDSDLSRVNDAGGAWTTVDRLFVEAVEAALRAAAATGGLVDPTLGEAMLRIGYDRDFPWIPPDGPALPSAAPWLAAPTWRLIDIRHDRSQVRAPVGVRLDLGSTAKALAADRAAARAAGAVAIGVLVALGGDIAVAGQAPVGGWRVLAAEDHATPVDAGGEMISLTEGAVATSSVMLRRWTRDGIGLHHLVDPRTGRPADGPWRTASVAAATCVDANIAATAAILLGSAAKAWLVERGLAARLVSREGTATRVAGWPDPASTATASPETARMAVPA